MWQRSAFSRLFHLGAFPIKPQLLPNSINSTATTTPTTTKYHSYFSNRSSYMIFSVISPSVLPSYLYLFVLELCLFTRAMLFSSHAPYKFPYYPLRSSCDLSSMFILPTPSSWPDYCSYHVSRLAWLEHQRGHHLRSNRIAGPSRLP